MGSPLSPVLANLFVENFEQTTFLINLKYGSDNVDDTFVIWPHNEEHITAFHENKKECIQFTMGKTTTMK